MSSRARRDRQWRVGAAMVLVGSCALAQAQAAGGLVCLACFVLALGAIAVLVRGHHVRTIWRAELRGHGTTAQAVHAARVRRWSI